MNIIHKLEMALIFICIEISRESCKGQDWCSANQKLLTREHLQVLQVQWFFDNPRLLWECHLDCVWRQTYTFSQTGKCIISTATILDFLNKNLLPSNLGDMGVCIWVPQQIFTCFTLDLTSLYHYEQQHLFLDCCKTFYWIKWRIQWL